METLCGIQDRLKTLSGWNATLFVTSDAIVLRITTKTGRHVTKSFNPHVTKLQKAGYVLEQFEILVERLSSMETGVPQESGYHVPANPYSS